MNQNNLNNKFGECCNCPALSTGDQYFTNYVSSRLFNNNLQNKLGLKDSNSLRLNLQTNGTKYMSNENNYINIIKTNNIIINNKVLFSNISLKSNSRRSCNIKFFNICFVNSAQGT